MAITKIHAIKSTLGKALAYIENPDKTDGQMLVSGYNCEPQTASIDFEMTAVLALPSKGIERLFIPEKYVVCNAANAPEIIFQTDAADIRSPRLPFFHRGRSAGPRC